jgi:NAD(P)-dependent dehydrogenase (short-subunit alcohol dehydrogenase family)
VPTVLITSANRGLGLEFASQYLADGWHVYAACRQPKSAEKLQRLAQKEKEKVDIFAMDVTNGSSIDRAAKKIGGDAIDVLINSAGITGKPGQKTGHVDYASWAQVLDVNTMGPLRVISCVLVNPGWVRTDMGGPSATLSPKESVTALRRLIETFGPAQSGKFFNYDGREYPW